MKSLTALALALAALVGSVPRASGHFHMVLADKPSVKKGETATFLYLWGHPFEHQLFDAPQPEKLYLFTPRGGNKAKDIASMLEKTTVKVPGEKEVVAYRLRFTPEERGDYTFVLLTPPVWLEEEKIYLQDSVRVVLHVQAQGGWDLEYADLAGPALPQLAPLTRPYGLQPGMVFQAQAKFGGQNLGGIHAEVERYNPRPPGELPPDEQITRTIKADPNGVLTCTLPESGWWCITAQRRFGVKEHDGKEFPVQQRASMWVFVDEAGVRKPGE